MTNRRISIECRSLDNFSVYDEFAGWYDTINVRITYGPDSEVVEFCVTPYLPTLNRVPYVKVLPRRGRQYFQFPPKRFTHYADCAEYVRRKYLYHKMGIENNE